MPLLPAKCTECGGFIEVDNEKKLGVCPFCGQPYVVEEAVQIFKAYYNTTNNYSGTVVNIYEDKSKDFVIEGGVLKKYTGASVDVVIPKGVVEIADNCFEDMKITSVIISDSVKHIGDNAFLQCEKLTSVTIPSSITSIGSDAFLCCDAIERVNITDIAAWCTIDFCNTSSNPLSSISFNGDVGNLFLNGDLVTELVIPNGVTKIEGYAFWGARCLTSVTIPDSVTSIGQFAFNCCPNLKTVKISDRIIRLGRGAFKTYWESKGLCSFCGGVFKEGLFSTKCKRCNEKKIY